ncbi:hypothetical protein MPSEU_000175300 [Mayamaea pseudoterrestris]|nr:hypothetical protein MPSEU_000175300 [Mayamaea pseudoterrestris]
MIMFPEANIPVVCVSLHASMDAEQHLRMGQALGSLRENGTLIIGSGYSFHNLPAYRHPTEESIKASRDFDDWLKETLLQHSHEQALDRFKEWSKAPGGRLSHPKEEHLLPLLVVAAAGGKPRLVFEEASDPWKTHMGHAVSGYVFE